MVWPFKKKSLDEQRQKLEEEIKSATILLDMNERVIPSCEKKLSETEAKPMGHYGYELVHNRKDFEDAKYFLKHHQKEVEKYSLIIARAEAKLLKLER
jgi:hypothetical protein|tara:strand:- start:150 stop:443 length:294 start_codon:yes stop_codon:yes gene_type:complete